jgi:hypothetical protein
VRQNLNAEIAFIFGLREHVSGCFYHDSSYHPDIPTFRTKYLHTTITGSHTNLRLALLIGASARA